MTSLRFVLALCVAGCSDSFALRGHESPAPDSVEFAQRFLVERAFRRESLENAVVNPKNGYSALRLSKYATEEHGAATGWDALDEWNAPVRAVTTDGTHGGATEGTAVWDGRVPETDAEWLELGRRAFELWPVEVDDKAGTFALDAAARERFGLWTDYRGRVAGLVSVSTADGREHAAWTCSGCHARPGADGRLIYGAPAFMLDRGAMSPPLPDGSAPEGWAWGPGALDVTADGIVDPTAILDLRATAHQSHLHCEATLVNGLPALTVRIETLLIENAQEQLRPPREVAVALALYVEALGAPGHLPDADGALGSPQNNNDVGAALFDTHCAQCHHADGSTAEPVGVGVVDTDARAAESPMRGNGVYRVPSLWKVSDRGDLLHDASVPDLTTLLDPARVATKPGHAFGLELSAEERNQLIAFLGTIGR